MTINRESEDIYKYADAAYNLCITEYLKNDELDDDVDVIIDKLVDISEEICLNYIKYDDLAFDILIDNIYDFTYYYNNIGIDFTVMEIIENPLLYCNIYINDLVAEKISDTVLYKLVYVIRDFNKSDDYRKKFEDILLL